MAKLARQRDWISRMRPRTATAPLALGVVLALVIATRPAQAQTFTVLYNFKGSPDGANPYAGLLMDTAGNLYGTTTSGGTSKFGTVFKVNKAGKETVLHSFAGSFSDGSFPDGGLVQDANGNLYGTTKAGGTFRYGYGTVFKVSKTGKETVLYSFTGGTDGCYPFGTPSIDKRGTLYGTTEECGGSNVGITWKVGKRGTEIVLHTFGGSDGADPAGGMVWDAKANLYGLTQDGGTYNEGVLYQGYDGGGVTVLHSFDGSFNGGIDGCYPSGSPAVDTKGNLYGTTSGCGYSNKGIVWKVSKKGKETILHNFAGGASDGEAPYAGVILDAKGNLYGTTTAGGASNGGVVYEVNTKGVLTVLHSFTGSDGQSPSGVLIMDAQGNLYGTAVSGGSNGSGTVWKLTP
jgi:uncharacterized repeat protein (TIGR03803 family)